MIVLIVITVDFHIPIGHYSVFLLARAVPKIKRLASPRNIFACLFSVHNTGIRTTKCVRTTKCLLVSKPVSFFV